MAQLKDLIVNGPSRFIGDVYATTFTGNLAGNASTATNATNAGMIAGLSVHSGRNNEANKIVRTDGNGYLQVGYINSSSGHEKNASNPTYVWGSNSSDSYLRSYQTSSLSVNYATSSGSCSGNAATATKAGCLDTGGMALYANHDNEINFGGTNTSSIIFFGYRATGSKPIPTSFIFGGSGGTASLTAGGFKKKDSSASYVLTGDGGHAAISGLSVNYANSSGSCSGNAATATNASSAKDADKLDGVHYQNILERYYSGYSSSGTATGWFRIAETLIDDGRGITFLLAIQRDYSHANNESYLFSISVSFGGGISITQLSGYANTRLITKIRVDWARSQVAYVDLYIGSSTTNNNYYWYTVGCAKSYTAWTANPTLMGEAHEFTTVQGCKSDKGFTGYLTGTASSSSKWTYARTITLTGSVTGSVSIDGSANVTLATTTNHTHNYLPLSGGTMSNTNVVTNLNADLLDGYHADNFVKSYLVNTDNLTRFTNRAFFQTSYISGQGDFGTLVIPTWNGNNNSNYFTTELRFPIGSFNPIIRCIHNDNTTDWKTIALVSDNVASATKLQNSRTIWGQSFDGTGDVSGAMSDVETINFVGNWMKIGLVRNSSNSVQDLIIQANGGLPLSINSNGPNLRISDSTLTWGDNTIYHSGNCNLTTVPWSCSNLILKNGGMIYNGGRYGLYVNSSAGDYGSAIYLTHDHGRNQTAFRIHSHHDLGLGGLSIGFSTTTQNYGASPLDATYADIVHIRGNGNVGIGTTSPTYKLDVVGTVKTAALMSQEIELSSSTPFIDFHYGNSTADFTSRIIEGLSGQLTVTGKLRVGLGYTTSTDYAFHVVGAGYTSKGLVSDGPVKVNELFEVDGTSGGWYGKLKINDDLFMLGENTNIDFIESLNIKKHNTTDNTDTSIVSIDKWGDIILNAITNDGDSYEISNRSGSLVIGIHNDNPNVLTIPSFLMSDQGYIKINALHLSSPSYPLDVNGTIQCTKLLQTSDIKYKTNIKQIEYEEALKIIENLNPVTWDWNENTVETGSSSGFVAQEAEEFIPNAISRDNKNNLSLDYTQLHSYEIKVIQEQQKEIIKLKEKLNILEKLIS